MRRKNQPQKSTRSTKQIPLFNSLCLLCLFVAIGSVSYLRVSAFIRGYLLTRIRRKNQPQKSTRSTKTDSSLQQFVLSVPLRGYRFGFLSAFIRVYPRLLIDAVQETKSPYKKSYQQH